MAYRNGNENKAHAKAQRRREEPRMTPIARKSRTPTATQKNAESMGKESGLKVAVEPVEGVFLHFEIELVAA